MSGRADANALYPFLDAGAPGAEASETALLQSVAAKAAESRETNQRFFADEAAALIAAAQTLADVWRRGGRLFTMGNGGSSCDAAHVAVEFLHPITPGRPALPAVNLTGDIAMVSAVGNDVGFEQVFARQIEAQARRGDGLIGFSTSGNSANLIAAFTVAKRLGLATVGFSGGDGGYMKTHAAVDHCLSVPSYSVHRIQECHIAAYHILWDLVHTLLAGARGEPGAGA